MKRTDLGMGVAVLLLLLGSVRPDDEPFNDDVLLVLVVVACRDDGLRCFAAVKSGEREGSFGCDILDVKGFSASVLFEKPRNCAIKSPYWLCRARICSLRIQVKRR